VNHTTDRSDAAALRPLSDAQKKQLILMAREAWMAAKTGPDADAGADDCPFDIPTDRTELSFDDWRRAQCMLVVERPGLTACRNEDYLPLKAHFLRLLGRHTEADAALERAEMEPRAYVLFHFQAACKAAAGALDNPVAYASGFLRKAEGCGIDDAPDRALWRAIYLLRRKAGLESKKTRKARAA
jgi:hypothetical protein